MAYYRKKLLKIFDLKEWLIKDKHAYDRGTLNTAYVIEQKFNRDLLY